MKLNYKNVMKDFDLIIASRHLLLRYENDINPDVYPNRFTTKDVYINSTKKIEKVYYIKFDLSAKEILDLIKEVKNDKYSFYTYKDKSFAYNGFKEKDLIKYKKGLEKAKEDGSFYA